MKVQQLLDQAAHASTSKADIEALRSALVTAFSATKSLSGLQSQPVIADLEAVPSFTPPEQEQFTSRRRAPRPLRRVQAAVRFERPIGSRFWSSIVLVLQAEQLSVEVRTCMEHEQVVGHDVPVMPTAQQSLLGRPTDTVAVLARDIAKVAIAQHVEVLMQLGVSKAQALELACEAWQAATRADVSTHAVAKALSA